MLCTHEMRQDRAVIASGIEAVSLSKKLLEPNLFKSSFPCEINERICTTGITLMIIVVRYWTYNAIWKFVRQLANERNHLHRFWLTFSEKLDSLNFFWMSICNEFLKMKFEYMTSSGLRENRVRIVAAKEGSSKILR